MSNAGGGYCVCVCVYLQHATKNVMSVTTQETVRRRAQDACMTNDSRQFIICFLCNYGLRLSIKMILYVDILIPTL